MEVAFLWHLFAVAYPPTGFSFHPSLTVAVLGILDVLSGVQESFPIKSPIDVAAVRSISAVVDDPQDFIVLFDSCDSAHSSALCLLLPLLGSFTRRQRLEFLS